MSLPFSAKASVFGKSHVPSDLFRSSSPVVLMVEDHLDVGDEMKHVLELNGYHVIETDNGQDAAKRARYNSPDLLLVDLDVPLLYELVAARQIIKHARLGTMPVVIVTHEDVVDTIPMMEVGVRRNEYVTRLSDYEQLEHLLDYLLPVAQQAAHAARTRSWAPRASAIASAIAPLKGNSPMLADQLNPEVVVHGRAQLSPRRLPANKPKVLIVESHDDTREMLRIVLETKGCLVMGACNGLEGVELARKEQPDLILMAGGLPLLGGLAATRRIREDALLRGVLIIALNSWGTPSYHAAALDAGCNDCLVKPIDFAHLESYLALLFDPGRSLRVEVE